MSFRPPTRRLIALAAAYLVAAQAVLLPLSVAAASPMLTSICVSAPDGAGHQPAGSANGCGCAATCGVMCCAPATLAAPPAGGRAPPAVVQVLPPVAAFVAVIRAADRVSHRPRAPPLA
ncbi:MAG: hypothetical protein JSR72_14765 [Proteobacteria bacterium]|nr:hypothetical protein [Pseudomonadota bacterium]